VLTVRRTLAARLPNIPHLWVNYAANHYAQCAVQFAVMRAERVDLPPVSLDSHPSEKGVFVME
jgi:hypothetical protein